MTRRGIWRENTRPYYPGAATYADDAAIEALGLGQGWWVVLHRMFENRGKDLGLPPESSGGEAMVPETKTD